MKENETDYLNKLFATAESRQEDANSQFPLVDVPERLSNRLYAIADSSPRKASSLLQRLFRPGRTLSGVAASLLVTVMVVQAYQQYQTMQQLEQAQADLATALQYLNEANQIARAQVLSTLNGSMNKAAVEQAVEKGREAVLSPPKELQNNTDQPNRTL
jgi:hypothetical protein